MTEYFPPLDALSDPADLIIIDGKIYDHYLEKPRIPLSEAGEACQAHIRNFAARQLLNKLRSEADAPTSLNGMGAVRTALVCDGPTRDNACGLRRLQLTFGGDIISEDTYSPDAPEL